MASEAQISANRLNAHKSTGPRTPEGKVVASQNAVTHGFLARATVIAAEDPGEFAVYRDWKLRDLAPAGDAELDMAERIVGLSWRLRRAERLQTEAFDALYEKMAMESAAGGTPAESTAGTADGGMGADRLLGRMLVEDFSHARVLDKLLLYERRIENSLYRSIRELREQKRMRLAGVPVELMSRMSESGTGLWPVLQEHGRDAHATKMPAGVPMNVPVAQRSSCETNPIPGGARAGDDWSRNQLCKTNPILAGTGEIAVPRGKKGGNEPLQDELCKTKPISRGDSSAPAAVRRVA